MRRNLTPEQKGLKQPLKLFGTNISWSQMNWKTVPVSGPQPRNTCLQSGCRSATLPDDTIMSSNGDAAIARPDNVKVFQKVQQLAPQFAPRCAMADVEEASGQWRPTSPA